MGIILLHHANEEERGIFRSKPTVGSVCGGMCRDLPFARNTPQATNGANINIPLFPLTKSR